VREVGRADHASTEQLSALVDGRAEPDERLFLASHVEQCAACFGELAALRSVRDLLRALPVYLPPRSFTIPDEAARPGRRFRRLIPLTRALGAIAALLCVVLFSVDAMWAENGTGAPISDGSGAMQLSTGSKPASAPAAAAKPAEPVARQAPEAGQPADAAPKTALAPALTATPAPPLAAGAMATAPPRSAAPANTPPQPQPTITASDAAQPAGAQAPAPATATARGQSVGGTGPATATSVQRTPAPAPIASPWLSPLRLGSLAFALIAAALLIGSLVLSRLARVRPGARAGRARG
jgi:hypothetical protein